MLVSEFFVFASKQRHLSHKLLVGLLILYISLVHVQSVSAQSSLTVDPAFQEVLITEDTSEVAATISFRNDSTEIIELELFAYDFTQADLIGSVGLLPPNQSYPHTLASFLEFEQNTLVINPGDTQSLTVRVRNRASLTPGGHYAAVVARLVQPRAEQEQQKVVPAVSALLLVRKTGGEQYHLSLSDTSWQPGAVVFSAPQKLELLLRNDGNVHDIPRGKVIATGVLGKTLYEGTINQASLYVLPGTQRRIPVVLEQRQWLLPIDLVSLQTEGYGQFSEIPFTQDESFILIRWQVVVLLFAIGVGGVIWWFWRRRQS